MLEDALHLPVHGGSVRHGFSSVEGDHVSLEPGSLGYGGKDLTKKHLIG